jgi:hypothetical protein
VTKEEAIRIGADARKRYDNLFIRSFAAEAIGESYPLSSTMTRMVIEKTFGWTDEQLGRKIAAWMDKK